MDYESLPPAEAARLVFEYNVLEDMKSAIRVLKEFLPNYDPAMFKTPDFYPVVAAIGAQIGEERRRVERG